MLLAEIRLKCKCNLFNVDNTQECLRNLLSRWLVIMRLTITQIILEFGNVGFYEGRKTGVPGEKPSEQSDENQQQSQPTYDAETGNRTRARIGERPAWEANANIPMPPNQNQGKSLLSRLPRFASKPKKYVYPVFPFCIFL